jgi:hypothetical protein
MQGGFEGELKPTGEKDATLKVLSASRTKHSERKKSHNGT